MVYSHHDIRQCLDHSWRSLPRPTAVHVSCVANDLVNTVTEWTQANWQTSPDYARVEKAAQGVTNSYPEYTRLGVDRWLSLIAAHQDSQRPACVIDCGTAITIDGLQADGQHIGGIILPGLGLMQESLYATAASLGESRGRLSSESQAGLAQSTEEGIISGCRLAAAGAIEMIRRKLQEKYADAVDYVITGGDAEIIMADLPCNPRHEPHLVLQGLAIIAGADS